MRRNATIVFWCILATIALAASVAADRPAYDPLAVSAGFAPATVELVVHDQARERVVPLFVYLPATTEPAPVALFSHGLGGSRHNNAFLGKHWAARGYVAVFLQHAGSDEAVWRNAEPRKRKAALKKAASAENLKLRVQDVSAVLDQLGRWRKIEGHVLFGRLDMDHVGMSGHSFGAITTQYVAGQRAPLGLVSGPDARIKAAIMFSPSSPQFGRASKAFGAVKIPWLLMTGAKDVAAIGDADAASRLAVYPALPPGGKYEVVLDNAEHSAFSDRALPGDREARNPNHHRAMLALTAAFWDAYLKNDDAAKKWLDGDGPRSILEENDRWQRK